MVTDKKGHLKGVIALSEDKEITIETKAVIITTGGFAGNEELIKTYIPSYNKEEIRLDGLPHQESGFLMASEIGAAQEDAITLEIIGPAYFGPASIASFTRRPNMLWINKKGERFADESTIFHIHSKSVNALFQQPSKMAYALFDESIKQSIIQESPGPFEYFALHGKAWLANIETDLKSQLDKDTVKIAGSWDEIAQWISVAPEILNNIVEIYNLYCKCGYDEVFAKERQKYLIPLRTLPYYALKDGIAMVATHGGIKVTMIWKFLIKMIILSPGLYAAGVDTGGTDADTYNFALTDHSFGFAINGGRIAGENAANYAINKN